MSEYPDYLLASPPAADVDYTIEKKSGDTEAVTVSLAPDLVDMLEEVAGLAGSVKFSPVHMEFLRDLSFKEWQAWGFSLQKLRAGLPFFLGDWMKWGQGRFGERYSQAMEATGFAYQTVANCQWVCERIPPERRRASLSFGVHAEVASLGPDAQEAMLGLAERHGWTVADTRDRKNRFEELAKTFPSADDVAEVLEDEERRYLVNGLDEGAGEGPPLPPSKKPLWTLRLNDGHVKYVRERTMLDWPDEKVTEFITEFIGLLWRSGGLVVRLGDA